MIRGEVRGKGMRKRRNGGTKVEDEGRKELMEGGDRGKG